MSRPPSPRTLTLWYLAIPLMLWLYGWIVPIIALPLIGLLLWVLIPQSETSQDKRSITGLILFAVCAAIMVFSLGIDGHVRQTFDFLARNAIYSDLINKPWPIQYPDGRCLLYPSHFWLVPALVSQLFPAGSNLILQLWCWLGFLLLLLNLNTTLGAVRSLATVGAMLLICSLTTITDNVLNMVFYKDAIYSATFSLPSNLSQFFNTFHYFTIVSLCLSIMVTPKLPWRQFVTFSFILAALHPMCAAAALPWVLVRYYQESAQLRANGCPCLLSLWRTAAIKEILVGAPIVLISLVYYMSGDSNSSQLAFFAPYGPGWNAWGVFLYLSAVALNLLPLFLVYRFTRFKPLLYLAAILPLIQLCRFGCENGINEWAYKTVCVWTFLIAYALGSNLRKRSSQCLLLGLVIISAVPVARQLVNDKKIITAAQNCFRYDAANVQDGNKGSMVNAEKNDYMQHTAPVLNPSFIFKGKAF